MITTTFDTNLIIDVEERREGYEEVLKILELHNQKKLKICIPAIMASEKLVNGKMVENFNDFKKFLEKFGFKDVEILPPLCYLDISFCDYCLLAGQDMVRLEKEIHGIMFPKTEFEYSEYCKKKGININKKPLDKDWLNTKCDVLSIWSHIYHKKDIFITKDTDFHNNKDKLIKLGVKEILYPKAVLSKTFRGELI